MCMIWLTSCVLLAAIIFWSFSQFKTTILWHLLSHDSSRSMYKYYAYWFINTEGVNQCLVNQTSSINSSIAYQSPHFGPSFIARWSFSIIHTSHTCCKKTVKLKNAVYCSKELRDTWSNINNLWCAE